MRPDPTVFVRHGRVKPLLYRHPWLFAGSIERVEGEPSEGDVVDVRAPDGRFLARGFFSPRSALRVRLFAFEPSIEPDEAWLRSRIDAAAAYRRDRLAAWLAWGGSAGVQIALLVATITLAVARP